MWLVWWLTLRLPNTGSFSHSHSHSRLQLQVFRSLGIELLDDGHGVFNKARIRMCPAVATPCSSVASGSLQGARQRTTSTRSCSTTSSPRSSTQTTCGTCALEHTSH